jgi:FAD/FMN-containing dehydrogenase
VRVDLVLSRAVVDPGCVWGDVDHETQAFALAATGRIVSTTGVAGFTLGGGFGHLTRRFGFASDNLVGADVVTADGRLLRATATEHEDLFWGIRGGVPAEFHGRPVIANLVVHSGDPAQAERDLAPLRTFAKPLVDMVSLRPYTAVLALTDASWAPGFENYWRSDYLAGIPDAAIEVLAERLATISSPLSDFKIAHLGGAGAGRTSTNAWWRSSAATILTTSSASTRTCGRERGRNAAGEEYRPPKGPTACIWNS